MIVCSKKEEEEREIPSSPYHFTATMHNNTHYENQKKPKTKNKFLQ